MNPRLRSGLQAAAILIAGGIVYAPVVRGGWLWDDATEISANPVLRDPGGLWKIWLSPPGQDYFPLTASVHWLQWRLWAEWVAGYHLTNIGLHLLAALLFWRLLSRLGVRFGWLGGLLFAVHPLAVESVAWMSELKNTLSLPPLLLAAIAFVDFDEAPTAGGGRTARLAASGLWFLAAMLAKSAVAMFPLVILLYVWWRRRRIARADLAASLPFFAISLALGAATLWFQGHRVMAHLPMPQTGVAERVAGAGVAILFYLGKCLWPTGLLPIYPRWAISAASAWPWLALGAVAAILFVGWVKRAGWGRHLLLGFGWFLLNLLPVLGFVPLAYERISPVGDHLAYVAVLGLIGLAAAAASALAGKFSGRGAAWGPRLAGAGLLAALVVVSRGYAARFSSEEVLWTYTLARNPDAWLAHNNLGQIYLGQGRVADAVAQCEASAAERPEFAEGHNNLGMALARSGRLPEALTQWEWAIRLNPGLSGAHFNLADGLAAAGRAPAAIDEYRRGLRLDPGNVAAHSDLGAVLAREGRLDEAIAEDRAALGLQPDFAAAHNNLGTALAREGRLDEAVAEFERALRLEPDNPGLHRNLAYALTALGRNEEAAGHMAAAARIEQER